MKNPPNLVNRLRSVVIVLAKGVIHHREKVAHFTRLGQMERAEIHQKISERQLFAFKRQQDV